MITTEIKTVYDLYKTGGSDIIRVAKQVSFEQGLECIKTNTFAQFSKLFELHMFIIMITVHIEKCKP